MTETTKKEEIEHRLANAELKFERRFRHLQEAYESRLTALETEMKSTHAKIDFMDEDLMTAIVENFRFLNEANRELGKILDTVVSDLPEMKDRLEATFYKLFPDHPRYAAAFLDIIDKDWRKEH